MLLSLVRAGWARSSRGRQLLCLSQATAAAVGHWEHKWLLGAPEHGRAPGVLPGLPAPLWAPPGFE